MSNSEDSLKTAAYTFPQAFAKKDIDWIISFFADDVISMYPGWALPVNGKAANREAWINYFNKRETHPMSTVSVVTAASDEIGYSFGLWATAEVDEPNEVAGRYAAVWKRNNGRWEIVILSGHVHEDIRPFKF